MILIVSDDSIEEVPVHVTNSLYSSILLKSRSASAFRNTPAAKKTMPCFHIRISVFIHNRYTGLRKHFGLWYTDYFFLIIDKSSIGTYSVKTCFMIFVSILSVQFVNFIYDLIYILLQNVIDLD